MYSDKIMRAIKTHYPKDFEILKGILQTIPLSCKLMMKGGAEYMFVDTKEDEIGYEIINNKNAKNFAISFYSPFSYMEPIFRRRALTSSFPLTEIWKTMMNIHSARSKECTAQSSKCRLMAR